MTRGIVFDKPGTYVAKATSVERADGSPPDPRWVTITDDPATAKALEAEGYTVTRVNRISGWYVGQCFRCEPPKPAATRP